MSYDDDIEYDIVGLAKYPNLLRASESTAIVNAEAVVQGRVSSQQLRIFL